MLKEGFELRRDPMGVEPLYYWVKNPRINGPSVRELLLQGVPRKLSIEGLWSCLLGGCVQEPFTMVDGVRSLPPGCKLTVAADGAQKLERYWNPSFEIKEWKDSAEVESAVTEKLESVIVELLRGNDDPASFLSGGIDSSAIVALLRRKHSGRIRTFCVVHEDPRTDERAWAKMVAEKNETDHVEFMLTDAMIREGISDALAAYDQPSLDGINVYFASKFAAEVGAKRVFSGEGGDELFAGYDRFSKPIAAYKYAAWLRWVPGFFGRRLSVTGKSERVRKIAQMFGCNYDPYFLTRRQFSPAWAKRLVTVDSSVDLRGLYREQMEAVATADLNWHGDAVNRCSWMETRHNNLSMYIRDGVQMGAAVGVDALYPFMDSGLAELLFTIPGRYKCDSLTPKPLLVKAAGAGMPDEIVRRKKQGFALPFDKYCREALKDELECFVRRGGTGLFKQKEIESVWSRYLNGELSWMRIWHLFVVDNWCQREKIVF